MVHVKHLHNFETPPNPATAANESLGDYWKLGSPFRLTYEQARGILDENNYYYHSGTSHTRLIKLTRRLEQGLLSYDSCAIPELQRFVYDRGVQTGGDRRVRTLIRKLEEADDDAKFRRFLDLPPEVRNMIYALHFKTLELPPTFVQPPLCIASSKLRSESLGLFYENAKFAIQLEYQPPSSGDSDLKLSRKTVALKDNVPSPMFPLLKHLSISLQHYYPLDYTDGHLKTVATWEMDFAIGRCSLKFAQKEDAWQPTKVGKTRLQEVLNRIMDRDGVVEGKRIVRLCKVDLESIRLAGRDEYYKTFAMR